MHRWSSYWFFLISLWYLSIYLSWHFKDAIITSGECEFSHTKNRSSWQVWGQLCGFIHYNIHTICGIYCGIYYIKMTITMHNIWCMLHYNVQYVMFIMAYITLKWPLQYTIYDVYYNIYYITMTIKMYNMWRLLWHILHYNDHYNIQYVTFIVAYITLHNDHYNVPYVTFIVAYITLQRPLQWTICGVYRGVYHITTTITMYNCSST
jgi:hypothetical protein